MNYIENGIAKAAFMCHSDKKNIFLIGDSIRRGYCQATADALTDVAQVFWPDDNCRNTQYVITCLKKWAGMFDDTSKVDLVQFNCGHWDTAHWNEDEYPLTSEAEFDRNIRMIIRQLRKFFPNAKLVFATTTTMNPNGIFGVNPRDNAIIGRYNDIAVQIAKETDVFVNDLNGVTGEWGSEKYKDYCHFTEEASVELGRAAAGRLRELM